LPQGEWNNWNRFSATCHNESLCVDGRALAVPVVPPAKTRLGPASKFGLGPAGPTPRRADGLARAAGGGESKPARPAAGRRVGHVPALSPLRRARSKLLKGLATPPEGRGRDRTKQTDTPERERERHGPSSPTPILLGSQRSSYWQQPSFRLTSWEQSSCSPIVLAFSFLP